MAPNSVWLSLRCLWYFVARPSCGAGVLLSSRPWRSDIRRLGQHLSGVGLNTKPAPRSSTHPVPECLIYRSGPLLVDLNLSIKFIRARDTCQGSSYTRSNEAENEKRKVLPWRLFTCWYGGSWTTKFWHSNHGNAILWTWMTNDFWEVYNGSIKGMNL